MQILNIIWPVLKMGSKTAQHCWQKNPNDANIWQQMPISSTQWCEWFVLVSSNRASNWHHGRRDVNKTGVLPAQNPWCCQQIAETTVSSPFFHPRDVATDNFFLDFIAEQPAPLSFSWGFKKNLTFFNRALVWKSWNCKLSLHSTCSSAVSNGRNLVIFEILMKKLNGPGCSEMKSKKN